MSRSPARAARKQKIEEAQTILAALGMPQEQQNERAALVLLALLNLAPSDRWDDASVPLIGITPIMEFVAQQYGKMWAPNTRETVRRFTMHQFLQAGLVIANPDRPDRPTNSPSYCYQITPRALALLRKYGAPDWELDLRLYLGEIGTLVARYAQERTLRRLPLTLPDGRALTLSPGGQNALIHRVIGEFCPRFTPGGRPVYIGDTDDKWAFFDEAYLRTLGVTVESHGKMPDVVVHFTERNWLVLIEAVTSHGPVSAKRLTELKTLFRGSTAGMVFVTAFFDRATFSRYVNEIAWETEAWIAAMPDHMIHFNGERFLGPY